MARDALWPVVGLGTVATGVLVVALAVARFEAVAPALALLAAAYAVILVVDDPPLDARGAIVGAALLAIGEFAHLSLEARSGVTGEAGATTRRLGSVCLLVLAALFLGGILIALVDLVHASGLTIEAVGAAAALGAVGVLVLAARSASRDL